MFPRNPNSSYWHSCCRCIIGVEIVLPLTCRDDIREEGDDIRVRKTEVVLSELETIQGVIPSHSHGHMSLSCTLKLNISTTKQAYNLECVKTCIAQCRRNK